MTNDLKARLDAMVREKVKQRRVSGMVGKSHLLIYPLVALDLLRQIDERDARIEAQDLLIKANSLDGLRGLLDWALQQAKDAEAARAALKGESHD